MFQYKIIHNVLPTRATLYRDGISENPISNFCNAEEQTLYHLLINCTLKVDFWVLFQDWWYQKKNEVLNYCLLIAKYCIFRTSLRGDFDNFLFFISGKLEILKEIATAKKALPKFYRT